MQKSYDALVIGAGIVGTGIAYGLARQGHRVLCLDKNPAAGYGSTSNSSAIIRTFYTTLAGCKLAWEGMHYWRNWRDFLNAPADEILADYVELDALVLQNGEPDSMAAICGHQTALGIPWQTLDADELARRYPMLDLQSFAPPRRHDDPDFGTVNGGRLSGAICFPQSGYVSDPQLAARNMQDAARRHGATFAYGVRVIAVTTSAGRVSGVELDDGTAVSAPIVVNAAGPYSQQLNTLAGVTGDMAMRGRPLRQEVCRADVPAGLSGQVMISDHDIGNYIRTEIGGGLLVGGMEADCDPLDWIEDPDDLDTNPTEQWTAQMYRQGLRMPTLGLPNRATGVADLYDVTADWNPIYDVSALPGFYLAVGTSGNQFKNGPVAGDLMAGLIGYAENGGDHDAVPFAFDLLRTGGTLAVSTFSRNREPLLQGGNVLG